MIVAVEEVWNKFLLSPLEFARYVDELDSPWLKAYFDVGNVVFYGYPQDWIRTLGARIAKVHLKDFRLDRPNGRFAWTNIGDGDIDWLEVRRAFDDAGYRGLLHDRSRGGRRRLLEGSRRSRRPVPVGSEAGVESPAREWTIGCAASPRKSGTTITSIISWRTPTRFWSSAVTTRSWRRAAPSSSCRGGRRF